ncbi:ABC transporter ATP-binding protein [Oceaniradius stylonematis]|uniref:ABC transporter ATP-binding protein n=1 Tax=Oceaniradius stylonematis TaxID=2184161 RepID=UPI000F3ED7CF|nr:ABC transporter ATP-binding protein [Oceaniradius stylonematis]RNC94956.1 MAG: ABC transporter ATP-binding protein [Oricola sp.]
MASAPAKAPPPRTGVTFAAELTFEGIHLHYGPVHTLKGISLTVRAGEILCLLGPSGSGKTSLLRVAAGLERQTAGRVLMNGREVAGPSVFEPPEKRSVGLMFQDFALFPHMTVAQNVRFGLTDMAARIAAGEAQVAIDRVGLGHHVNSYPDVLSGGEQQRVALARALAPRPSVMLMDEPFSGLDTRLKDSVRAETLAILREMRATTIVVTHDAEEAMRLGDRIALLDRGRIVQAGTADEIYHDPANLFVAGFFSELNTFDARVEGNGVETPLGRFDAGRHAPGSELTVAIRTAGLDVAAHGGGMPPPGTVPGRITARRFLGVSEQLLIAIQGADKPVSARIRADELARDARDVTISVRNGDILLFESGRESA